MLNPATPFPYPGSYALVEHEGVNQLARILWRRQGFAAVGMPLVPDAGGTKVVAEFELIDATPLTGEETREFHDLDRAQADWVDEGGRLIKRLSAGQKVRRARRNALRQRIVYAPIMERLLRQASLRRAA